MTTPHTPDPLSTQEALHMASFLMRSVDAELMEHPAITEHADWLALVRTAHQALFDLYQALGASAAAEK